MKLVPSFEGVCVCARLRSCLFYQRPWCRGGASSSPRCVCACCTTTDLPRRSLPPGPATLLEASAAVEVVLVEVLLASGKSVSPERQACPRVLRHKWPPWRRHLPVFSVTLGTEPLQHQSHPRPSLLSSLGHPRHSLWKAPFHRAWHPPPQRVSSNNSSCSSRGMAPWCYQTCLAFSP